MVLPVFYTRMVRLKINSHASLQWHSLWILNMLVYVTFPLSQLHNDFKAVSNCDCTGQNGVSWLTSPDIFVILLLSSTSPWIWFLMHLSNYNYLLPLGLKVELLCVFFSSYASARQSCPRAWPILGTRCLLSWMNLSWEFLDFSSQVLVPSWSLQVTKTT